MTKTVKSLMSMNNDLWDSMGIESGSDFLDENEKYNKLFDEYLSRLAIELQKLKIKSISKKDYENLEDKNCHTMLKALKILKIA